MAAKKNAKKTTDSITPATNDSVKPVAKKATKTAKKAAATVQTASAELPLSDTAPVANPAPAATAVAPATEPTAPPQAKKSATKPSLDSIARGAYLNYRRRVEQGLPGDSDGDWLEAERQAAQVG